VFDKNMTRKASEMKTLIRALMLFAATNPLSAQTIINTSPTENRAYLRVGIEPTAIMTFGCQRNFNAGFLNRNITSYAEWGSSMYRFHFNNSELKFGVIFLIFEKGSFKGVNNLDLSAGSVATQNFDSKKFAAGDEVAAGLYNRSWFIAMTAEYEKNYLNRIEHTDFYRRTYYEDAKDGWYKGAGGMFQFGIEGGGTIKGKHDIHLEIKMPFTERFNRYGGSPFHVNLGLGYRF
jgi:hypothetical protein